QGLNTHRFRLAFRRRNPAFLPIRQVKIQPIVPILAAPRNLPSPLPGNLRIGLGKSMPSTVTSPKRAATGPKPRLSIPARLIILALLILVPLMLDRVRLLEATRVERIENAHAEALDMAKRGVDMQLEIVNSTRAVLQVVARAYLALAKPGEDCAPFV